MQIIIVLLICIMANLCEGEPRIYNRNGQGFINITDETIPSNVDIISIYLNQIEVIPSGYFINLPFVSLIDLCCIGIREVEDEAFAMVPTLENLVLRKNNIEIISKNMFNENA